MSSADEQAASPLEQLRVLVVENSESWRSDHAFNLSLWHCQPVIAEGDGKALLNDAENKAQQERCQIAIVDMHLLEDFDSNDISGLELVPRLRPAISIIMSGSHDRRKAVQALRKYGAANFVGKEDGPEVLQEALIEIAKEHAIASYRLKLEWSHNLSSPKLRDLLFGEHSDVPDDEVEEVISRLFLTNQRVVLTLISGDEPSSEHISAIRPRSRVFRANVDHQPAFIIVKLARADKIKREVQNYKDHVQLGNPGLFRPELLNEVRLWDLGAAAFSYLGNPGLGTLHGPKTFTSYYHSIDSTEQILVPLYDFFSDSNWGIEYTANVTILKCSLFEAYDSVLHNALSKQLDGWRSHERLRSFPNLPGSLPNPTRWLTEHYRESGLIQARQAVTHGDLHGDNLFVYEGHAWSIDFERTGPGPILRDFVELTHDILTRCAAFTDHDLPVFYELTVMIAAPRLPSEVMRPTAAIVAHQEALKAFLVVKELQQLAYQRTHYLDQREYLWSLLLNSMFVVTLLPENDRRRMRTLLLASVICGRLERWDHRTWMPRDWSPVMPVDPPRTAGAPSKPNTAPPAQKDLAKNSSHTGLFKNGYALLIGVGATAAVPSWSLPVTVNDARALCEVLVDDQLCGYPADQVRLLTDSAASATQIRDSLIWLAECTRAQPDATAVVYFSGHGWRTDDGRYALIPADVRPDDLPHSVIWSDDIIQHLRGIAGRRLLVCIDACHAEGMATAKDSWMAPGDFSKAPPPDLLATLSRGEGRVVISSSRGSQSSYYRRAGLSLFTYYLIEALHGAANRPGDTVVKISNVVNHLGEQVPRAALAEFHAEQIPWIDQAAEDFPIALLRGGKGLATEVVVRQPGPEPARPDAGNMSIKTIRSLLKRMVPAEFEGFCQDHFSGVAAAFSPGMDQDARINQLINYVQRRPEALERLWHMLNEQ